jgi:Putative addiction module component
MDMPQNQLIETALALPQTQRADLAFHLLQSLGSPGEEVSTEEFGAELFDRVENYRRGELDSFSLEETRSLLDTSSTPTMTPTNLPDSSS